MSEPDDFTYRETTPMPRWAVGLLWFACLAGVLGIGSEIMRIIVVDGLAGLLRPEGYTYLATGALVMVAPVLFHVLFGQLVVGVTDTHIIAAFGAGWISKRVRLEHVKGVKSVKYNPIREFGGWGIRGFGKKVAWTVRGDRAVVLHTRDGVRLYLGTATPQRLRERIETAIELHATTAE